MTIQPYHGAKPKAFGTGMIHDASGSLTSNYDAQSLRFALEALSLSLRARARRCHWKLGKRGAAV